MISYSVENTTLSGAAEVSMEEESAVLPAKERVSI